MSRITNILFALILTFGVVLEYLPAFAQQGDTEEFTLEEITVTAQKREEDQQKVAISMEVISGEELASRGTMDIMDALSGITGAIVQKVGIEMQVSIRGMDNDSPPGDSVSMVALNVDGAYSNSPGTGSMGLYDMERIEVLAGPQGTLYSRNSTGGVVNLESANPVDGYEASGSIEFGSYSLLQTNGMVNAPLSNKWAVRTAFAAGVRDGYISNGTDDLDLKSGRVKLKYTANDDLSVVFATEIARTGGKGSGTGGGIGGGGVNLFETEDDVTDPWTNDAPSDKNYTNIKKNRYWANLDWSLGIGELTFVPSFTFTKKNAAAEAWDGMMQEYRYRVDTNDIKEKSGELRFASAADSSIKWLIGLYYYKRYFFMEDDPQLAYTQEHRKQWNDDKSEAAFGNITYPFTNAFRFTGGGRYSKDRAAQRSFSGITETIGDWSYNESTSHFDYKLGVEYDVGTNAMAWADYSTGYRQGRGTPNEYLDSYQAGLKSRLLNQKLQMNATAYYYKYTNYNVRIVLNYIYWDETRQRYVSGMDGGEGYGDSNIYGLDLSSNYILGGNDRIDLSASFLHTEIADLTVTGFDYNPDQNYEGGEQNNSPHFTINAAYEHRFNLNNGGSITAKIDSTYRTKSQVNFFIEPFNVPAGMDADKLNTEPANHKTNASISYNSPDAKWSLNTYIKNIENHASKSGMFMGVLMIGAPRTYGAILSIKMF